MSSLLEMMLSQRLFVLSAGFAGLVLLAAIALSVWPVMVRAFRKRRERQHKKPLTVQEAAVDFDKVDETDVDEDTHTEAEEGPQEDTSEPQQGSTQKEPGSLLADAVKEPEKKPEAADSEVQQILADVFVDESLLEKNAALMPLLDEVDITELQDLASDVTQMLHGSSPRSNGSGNGASR